MERITEVKYSLNNLSVRLDRPESTEFYEELMSAIYLLKPESYYIKLNAGKGNSLSLSLFFSDHADMPSVIEQGKATLDEMVGLFLDRTKGQITMDYLRRLPWEAYMKYFVNEN